MPKQVYEQHLNAWIEDEKAALELIAVVGNPTSSIFDSPATIVSKDGKSVVLYVWYDNEYGYTRQVIRFAKQLAGVIRLRYY